MSMKLYGYWRSSASYRVRIALELKKLTYEYIPVHLVNNGGEQKSDAYKRLNPAMLVPTLIDDDEGITLNQSLAIIEYLDEKFPNITPLLPAHRVDRARIRTMAQDIACDIQPVTNLAVINKLKHEYGADTAATNKWCHDVIQAGFSALEKRLVMQAGKYAYGYTLSLADVCLVPQVYNAIRFNVDITQYPLINKVYGNCQLLEAFIKAAPEMQTDAPTSAVQK